ncbi:hypothetical protein [Campylobacter sp.]|nr:hypothetical protein [Campylobacter sp.]MDD6924591.1 hypothetical protein [Campylobacteraceae bacterium]MDY2817573.1 hypothetical protein [Campylobacter lanienae]MCI6564740.1 hypothetical protein [Campylobacter sp.]MCI6579306.1 hypothetical protein [Campylobacter sp.]MCI6661395.1 hypothetical protein [Campylobacter sp.]
MARNSLYHRSNLCVAVIAGGVYMCIGTIILAKNIDEKRTSVVTICWFF